MSLKQLQDRTHQNGYGNLFNQHALLRWKFPNSYQMPGVTYLSTESHRHRDSMQRVWQGPYDDRYLSPWDGHLAKLVVQSTDNIYEGTRNSTWRRTFIRNISPLYIQIANFPFSTVPADRARWGDEDWGIVAAKWIPTCCGLLFVVRRTKTASTS
jgi:hypothetical protein